MKKSHLGIGVSIFGWLNGLHAAFNAFIPFFCNSVLFVTFNLAAIINIIPPLTIYLESSFCQYNHSLFIIALQVPFDRMNSLVYLIHKCADNISIFIKIKKEF